MAYDKHTWTCDEPITVERLNHIEDGIANAGGDCGFECEETITLLTNETVTTVQGGEDSAFADLSYSELIDAETIKVTINGTEYECPRRNLDNSAYEYGAHWNDSTQSYDWSEYPFQIWSGDDGGIITSLSTETAGTYTVKIEAEETIITTTPCFDLARGYSCSEAVLTEETLIAIRTQS